MENMKVYNKQVDAVVNYRAGHLYIVNDVRGGRLAILRMIVKADEQNIYGIFVTESGERVINLVDVRIIESEYSHYQDKEINDVLDGYLRYENVEMYAFMLHFLRAHAEDFGDY